MNKGNVMTFPMFFLENYEKKFKALVVKMHHIFYSMNSLLFNMTSMVCIITVNVLQRTRFTITQVGTDRLLRNLVNIPNVMGNMSPGVY